MAVDGEAAAAVTEHAAEHWRAETGEALLPLAPEGDPWPQWLEPDFRDCRIAISRGSAWQGQMPSEVAALTTDALLAARQTIYIESQYMTASIVGNLIESRLQEPNGPEILVIMAFSARSLAERFTMGTNRDRLIRRLSRADRFGRLRIYYPCIPGDGRLDRVFVHAKLMIVDDIFLRIGSSNLNNRSMGLDHECDLAIEAENETTQRTIRDIRERLLAEHLCCTTAEVSRAITEARSLIGGIAQLNHRSHTMRAFDAMSGEGPNRPVPGSRLFDPAGPFTPFL
jgi:phosphatidylserine/phosphatidylglycerophosphate/cardiolipin synthase-like enzyme